MISEYFPAYHPKAGQETNFEMKIKNGTKKHTLRSNYKLWKSRIDEIEKGNAYLSIRKWEGKPYRSKQVEVIKLTKENQVGIQKVKYVGGSFFIEDNKVSTDKRIISSNDGLSVEDFNAWFSSYKPGEMAIIHFTEYRYPIQSCVCDSPIIRGYDPDLYCAYCEMKI